MFGLSRRLVVVIASVVVLGGSSYAFLAALTGLPTNSKAGADTQTVSGYALSNLSYDYNASNPGNIDDVKFQLDDAAGAVHIQLTSGGAWYACAADSNVTPTAPATAWVCDTTVGTQATVLAQDEISVVAHS